MADAPTFNDYFTAGRAEAIDRRPELTFDEGDISEMEMAAAAAMADHLTEYTAQRVKATFLDGAFGNDLTTLADDRYGLQRLAANAATVTITLTRASGTLIGTVPVGTTVATQKDSLGNEVQYTTDVDQAFASGQLTANVACTCTATGPGGNVAAGTINRMVSTGLFDTFTVTNAARAAGGADTEDDDSLKDRCRQFYSTLRRGTLKALEFGARGVAGVANVTASEPGDGTVSLFVSDASGGYSPTLLTDVSTEIENWRAGGVVVNVFGGSIIVVGGIDVSLTLRAGAVVKVADVQNAISGRINKLKIGEDLTTSLIKAAATSVDPDNILGVDVNSPAGTVSAVDGLGRRSIVLRTIPANVSVH
jgi:uncharacterized phage protein gp47/JayE